MTEIRNYDDGLHSAGQPTVEQLQSLACIGVRTIINLRGLDEALPFDEPREAMRLGMRYVSIPVTADALVPATMMFACELEEARRHGSTLIHCASGNRVGALVALERGLIRRVPPDEAIAAGRRAGLAGLESAVARLLDNRTTI